MEFVTPPTTPKKGRSSSLHKSKNISSMSVLSPNRSFSKSFDFDDKILASSENKPNFSLDQKSSSKVANSDSSRKLDRFIPAREAMDFDAINSFLEATNQENRTIDMSPHTPSQKNYDKRLNLLKPRLSSGKIMSVSKESKPMSPLIDNRNGILDLRNTEVDYKAKQKPRALPTCPCRVLDAPELLDDYYLNLLSWSNQNVIAIALKNSLYLWNASDGEVLIRINTNRSKLLTYLY
jgi:cell division cycle protein 20 (cofactor of APC complex)